MDAPRGPGWFLEPDSTRVERYWDAVGPTDRVRFRERAVIQEPLADQRPDRPERHPYRMWGPKYWLTVIPWIGNLFALDFLRGRGEAVRSGEIKAWPSWVRVAAVVFAVGLIVWWLVDVWVRVRS